MNATPNTGRRPSLTPNGAAFHTEKTSTIEICFDVAWYLHISMVLPQILVAGSGHDSIGAKKCHRRVWGTPFTCPGSRGSRGVLGFELTLNDIPVPKLRSTKAKPKL